MSSTDSHPLCDLSGGGAGWIWHKMTVPGGDCGIYPQGLQKCSTLACAALPFLQRQREDWAGWFEQSDG